MKDWNAFMTDIHNYSRQPQVVPISSTSYQNPSELHNDTQNKCSPRPPSQPRFFLVPPYQKNSRNYIPLRQSSSRNSIRQNLQNEGIMTDRGSIRNPPPGKHGEGLQVMGLISSKQSNIERNINPSAKLIQKIQTFKRKQRPSTQHLPKKKKQIHINIPQQPKVIDEKSDSLTSSSHHTNPSHLYRSQSQKQIECTNQNQSPKNIIQNQNQKSRNLRETFHNNYFITINSYNFPFKYPKQTQQKLSICTSNPHLPSHIDFSKNKPSTANSLRTHTKNVPKKKSLNKELPRPKSEIKPRKKINPVLIKYQGSSPNPQPESQQILRRNQKYSKNTSPNRSIKTIQKIRPKSQTKKNREPLFEGTSPQSQVNNINLMNYVIDKNPLLEEIERNQRISNKFGKNPYFCEWIGKRRNIDDLGYGRPKSQGSNRPPWKNKKNTENEYSLTAQDVMKVNPISNIKDFMELFQRKYHPKKQNKSETQNNLEAFPEKYDKITNDDEILTSNTKNFEMKEEKKNKYRVPNNQVKEYLSKLKPFQNLNKLVKKIKAQEKNEGNCSHSSSIQLSKCGQSHDSIPFQVAGNIPNIPHDPLNIWKKEVHKHILNHGTAENRANFQSQKNKKESINEEEIKKDSNNFLYSSDSRRKLLENKYHQIKEKLHLVNPQQAVFMKQNKEEEDCFNNLCNLLNNLS